MQLRRRLGGAGSSGGKEELGNGGDGGEEEETHNDGSIAEDGDSERGIAEDWKKVLS